MRPPSGGEKERREGGEEGVEVEGMDSERRRRMGRMRGDGLRWEDIVVGGKGKCERVGVGVYLSVCNPLQGQCLVGPQGMVMTKRVLWSSRRPLPLFLLSPLLF